MSTQDAAEALRRDQDDWLAPLLNDLQLAERDQSWDRVEGLCKQILQRDGDNWAIWQRLALSLEARSDWSQAETLWRHLTQRFSQRPEPYLALASLQRKRGAPDAARAVLQQAERRVGRSAELEASLKVIDDPWANDNSVPTLDQGAAANAVAAALQKAQEHLNAGRLAEAEAAFEQLVIARPNAVQFHRTLAQLRLRRGDNQAVINQLLPLFRQDQPAVQLLERMELPLLLLQGLANEQRWSEMEPLLAVLLEYSPQDARLVFLQARCALETGRDLEALPLLERTLQLAPNLAPAELALGELQMRLGDWDLAIASLEKAVALQPDSQQAASSLDQARRERLWQQGEHALMRGEWTQAENQFRALLEFGDEKRALARLDLLASLDPKRMGTPAEFEASGHSSAQALRLQQFSRMLDRLEGLLPEG